MAFNTRVVIPAYNAGEAVGNVVRSVRDAGWTDVLVVNDGSTDETAHIAEAAGARVIHHAQNQGKGAALRTALDLCASENIDVMLTLDADGQHRATDLRVLMDAAPDAPGAFVLGIRDLVRAGAPRANRTSNRISNVLISGFAGKRLADTQCGLRRYPVGPTIALGLRGTGYEMEAEVIIRAVRARIPIVEVGIDVHYPPERERKTHFRTRRDVPRIIFRVLEAVVTARR